ncbi:MAG: lysine biosynthesis protein LysX [Phycisphaerales bacterium]
MLAILHSRIRVEERLLVDELTRRGVEHELIDVRTATWDIHNPGALQRYRVVLERCVSQTQGVTAVRLFERFGVPCVNPAHVIDCCGDKLLTSLALAKHGVPTPRTKVAVEPEAALAAIEEMGYPVVLKPTVGSWGRLLARVNDRDAAEAILEHKATLGSVQHGVFYIQEYVNKPGRDLRVFMAGDDPVCGIVRNSPHWITNTARGGQAGAFTPDAATVDLCRRAVRAIGGGLVAIDLLECPDRGMLVSEINHTMEFRNSIEPTGVNIPSRIIDWALEVAQREQGALL